MFSRLKISHRLTIGFAFLLSLTIGLAYTAQNRVASIAESLSAINDVNSVKQRYTINFRGSVHDRAIALRDITLVKPAELDAVIATIDTLAQAYAVSASLLDKLMAGGQGVTADEQSVLAEIKQTEARTLPIVAEVIRLQRAGQAEPAHKMLMDEARPAFVEWLARINKFIDLEEAKNKSVGAHARSVAEGFLLLITAVCLGAILAGGAVSFWSLGAIRPLSALTEAMKKLAAGDHTVAIPSLMRRDEIGAMAATIDVFKSSAEERKRLETEAAKFGHQLDERLKETEAAFSTASEGQRRIVALLAQGLAKLASGDLTARLTESVSAEYETVKTDFNEAIQSLQKALSEISSNATGIRSGAGEISNAVDELSRRTEQQAASLEQTATALDEITVTVRKTAEGAKHASSVVAGARCDVVAPERPDTVTGRCEL